MGKLKYSKDTHHSLSRQNLFVAITVTQIIPLKQLTYFSQCFKQSSCWPYHKNIKVKAAAAESGPCSTRMVSPQQKIMLRRGYVEVGTNPLLVLWPAEHLLFNYFRFLLLLAFAEKVHILLLYYADGVGGHFCTMYYKTAFKVCLLV